MTYQPSRKHGNWCVVAPYIRSLKSRYLSDEVPFGQEVVNVVPLVLKEHNAYRESISFATGVNYLLTAYKAYSLAERGVIACFPPLAVSCAAAKATPAFRRKYVIADSFNIGTISRMHKNRVIMRLIQKIDAFIVYSRHEKDVYIREFGIKPERVHFSHLARAEKVHLPPPKKRVSDRFILAIGNAKRDYHLLCEAASGLDLRIKIVCSAGKIKDLSLPSNIEFIDMENISYMEGNRLVAESEFVVLPLEKQDTASGHITAVEAFKAGKTVIGTLVPGIMDYIASGETGLLVEQGDKTRLGDQMDRLWRDNVLRTRLETNAKTFAEDHYTLSTASATRHAIINQLLAQEPCK